MTSLGPRAPARQLLRLIREHWHIESRLHDVRDVAPVEEASRVRSGATRQALAALRDAVPGLLRRHCYPDVTQALRHSARSPGAALLLLGPRPTS